MRSEYDIQYQQFDLYIYNLESVEMYVKFGTKNIQLQKDDKIDLNYSKWIHVTIIATFSSNIKYVMYIGISQQEYNI